MNQFCALHHERKPGTKCQRGDAFPWGKRPPPIPRFSPSSTPFYMWQFYYSPHTTSTHSPPVGKWEAIFCRVFAHTFMSCFTQWWWCCCCHCASRRQLLKLPARGSFGGETLMFNVLVLVPNFTDPHITGREHTCESWVVGSPRAFYLIFHLSTFCLGIFFILVRGAVRLK